MKILMLRMMNVILVIWSVHCVEKIWKIMNPIREDSFEVYVLVASTGRELRFTSDQEHGVRKKVFWIFVRLFARVQHDIHS